MLSEIEALSQLTDFQQRKFLKEQIALKKEIQEALREPNLSVFKEQQLNDALSIIVNNIQKMRMSGIL